MPKLTVRLSEEAGQILSEFMSTNGVTMSAWLEAISGIYRSQARREVPVESWPKRDPYRQAAIDVVIHARKIDAQRRSRRPL